MGSCKLILVLDVSLLTCVRFGSAGAWGLGLPFIVEQILNRFGYATTLRAFAVGIVSDHKKFKALTLKRTCSSSSSDRCFPSLNLDYHPKYSARRRPR
jgi:hypothetical protein